MKDLVCTKCGKTLVSEANDETAKLMTAGFCNDQTCLGKLEWNNVS